MLSPNAFAAAEVVADAVDDADAVDVVAKADVGIRGAEIAAVGAEIAELEIAPVKLEIAALALKLAFTPPASAGKSGLLPPSFDLSVSSAAGGHPTGLGTPCLPKHLDVSATVVAPKACQSSRVSGLNRLPAPELPNFRGGAMKSESS